MAKHKGKKRLQEESNETLTPLDDISIGKDATIYSESINRIVTGTVTYIHPEKRFFSVRFDCGGGKLSESILFR